MTSKPIRILLSKAASDHLTASGESCFAVIGRASYPDDPSRWVLHLQPCDIATADNAVAVAQGRATARRLKTKIDFRQPGPTAET
jgi:hypothetical protein